MKAFKPTIRIRIFKIAPYLTRGLEYIKQDNITNWNKAVDEFWEDVEGQRHFWIGPLRFKTREDVEDYLGKPEEGEVGEQGTVWNKTRGATYQVQMYRQLLKVFEHNPAIEVTMLATEYTVIMGFDADEEYYPLVTPQKYFGKDLI